MAYQGKGFLDGFIGSVGNVTGYKRNGKSVIKSKNPKQTKPPSPTQEQTHQYFLWINIILNELIKKGWGPALNIDCNGQKIRDLFIKNIPILFGKGHYNTDQLNIFCNTDTDIHYEFFQDQSDNFMFWRILNRSNWGGANSKPTDQLYRLKFRLGSNFAEVNQYGSFPRSDLGNLVDTILQPKPVNDIAIIINGWVSSDYSRRWNAAIQRNNYLT